MEYATIYELAEMVKNSCLLSHCFIRLSLSVSSIHEGFNLHKEAEPHITSDALVQIPCRCPERRVSWT